MLLEDELHVVFGRVAALYGKNLAEAFSRLEPLVSVLASCANQCEPGSLVVNSLRLALHSAVTLSMRTMQSLEIPSESCLLAAMIEHHTLPELTCRWRTGDVIRAAPGHAGPHVGDASPGRS